MADEESRQSVVEQRLLRVDREVIREGTSWLQGFLPRLDCVKFDILIEVQVLLLIVIAPVIPSVLLPADLEHRKAIVSLTITENLLRLLLLLGVMLEPLSLKQGCLPLRRGLLERRELVSVLSCAEDLLVASVRINIASRPSLRSEKVTRLLSFHKVRIRGPLDLEHVRIRVRMKVMSCKSLETLASRIPSMNLTRAVEKVVVVIIKPRVSIIFLLVLVHIEEVLSLLQPILER